MNIKDFVKDGNIKQFSLFIQALSAMQNMPWKDQLSWFSLGGIHGYPYQPWGDSAATESASTKWKGYCTHGTVLFPTWHRPYVAAVEQFIHDRAVEIAKEYKDSDSKQWADAAESLRMPYWDWANDALPPDEVIQYETISIITPHGKAEVFNPLYSFAFKEDTKDFPKRPTDFSKWKTTLRYPTSRDSSAKSDVATLKKTLIQNAPQNRESVWRMLLFVREWENFSKHSKGSSTDISLEGIHDNMHNLIGGGGHMSETSMAGFDPIFYLHHCNVDRLLSEWATLYSDVWVTPGSSDLGTYTIPEDTTVDALTALTPFANSEKSYWSSSLARTTESLGYTYTLKPVTPSPANPQPEGPIPWYRSMAGDVQQSASDGIQLLADRGGNASETTNNSVYDWKVRVRVGEFELGESFQVLIFLGSAPDDYTQWMEDESYVGCVGVFVNEIPQSCPNCASRPDEVVQGTVYLTQKIVETSSTGSEGRFPRSLDPSAVSPYLEQTLTWRVRKVMGGLPVPLSDVPSLEVTVFSTYLTKGEGTIFPTLGETITHEQITTGKEGGYSGIVAAV
ncbi:tyrosinase [Irpex lacteus]|nr:tyrosinase [Irpex lacteus]